MCFEGRAGCVFKDNTAGCSVVCNTSDAATTLTALQKKQKKQNTQDLFGAYSQEKKKNQGKITAQNNESVLLLKRQKSKDNGTKAPWGKKMS